MSWLQSSLSPANGFHASYTTTISLALDPLLPRCSLHLLHTLPAHVFVDPYELSHHESAYTFRHSGTSNLELPVAAVASEPSTLLLNITLSGLASLNITVQVPMHLRYGVPAELGSSGYHTEQIPPPVGFLACPVHPRVSSPAPPVMPTEFSSLFESHSITVISSRTSDGVIQIPVGSYGDLDTVEIGTMLVILLAFLIVLRASLKAASRLKSDALRAKIE